MNDYVIVRGAGDLATGVVQKLFRSGFKTICLEVEKPTSIRRLVSLSQCIYDGEFQVEDIKAKWIEKKEQIDETIQKGIVPVLIDPNGDTIYNLKPHVVVDSILAKKNLGTNKNMAPFTIALGPGFEAPTEVDCVIETIRGHDLGRLIYEGSALPNTEMPGEIGGVSLDRVIYAAKAGKITNEKHIGDIVKKNEIIARINNETVYATINGVLRGIINDGFLVSEGMKIADIDPRISETKNCFTISDKARCLGGAVLEAIMIFKRSEK